jgi:hypothetical protein
MLPTPSDIKPPPQHLRQTQGNSTSTTAGSEVFPPRPDGPTRFSELDESKKEEYTFQKDIYK